MSNANLVVLMGRLTKDPELKFIPNGNAVCNLSLAINRTWNNNDGTKGEEVTFVDVTCWAKTAENVAKYMKKGSGIYMEGRLQQDRWQDPSTGQTRHRMKVVANTVQFLPRGGGGGDQQQGQAQPQGQAAPQGAPAPQNHDDIPF